MRVAAYCRVSTNSKDQQNSFENQKSYFEREISKREDYELVKIYPDKGITGTKLHRPEFDKMLYDAGLDIIEVQNADKDERKKYKKYITIPSSTRKPKFDIILTKNTSRFARNVEVESILRDLARNRVYVHFLDLNKSTEKQEDITYIQIFQSFDERESRDKSTKVLFGIHEGIRRGVIHTHSKIYGYQYVQEDNRLEIVPEEAEVVRLIFSLYLEGKGVRQIIHYLSEHKIRTRQGNLFGKTTIRNVLSNEKYAGLNNPLKYDNGLVFNRNTYAKVRSDYSLTESDKIPAIISKKTFDECQVLLKSKVNYQNQKGVYKGNSTYSGLLVCGQCGAVYYSNQDRGRVFYNCSNKKAHGLDACNSPNVSSKYLEKFLTELADGEFYQHFLDKKKTAIDSKCLKILDLYRFINTDHNEAANNIQTKIQEETEKLNSYRELYVSSKTNREYLKDKIEQIENGIEELQNEYKTLTRNATDIAKEILNVYDEIVEIEQSTVKEKSTTEEVLESISKIIVYCQTSEAGQKVITLVPEASILFDNRGLKIRENQIIDRDHIEEIISEMKKIISFI
jgi:DNA invertase Pin-like site-specific DNA recombinase